MAMKGRSGALGWGKPRATWCSHGRQDKLLPHLSKHHMRLSLGSLLSLVTLSSMGFLHCFISPSRKKTKGLEFGEEVEMAFNGGEAQKFIEAP